MTDKFEVPKRYTALNDVTGDLIKSRTDEQDKYAEGWDRIFGNKKEVIEEFKDFPVEVVSTTVVFNPDTKCRVSVEKEDRPHVIEFLDNLELMKENVPNFPKIDYNSWNEHCVGWNSCYHCDNGYYPCNQNCMLE